MRWQLVPFDGLSHREVYALLALRQEVFVVEQRCAFLDADGRDLGALHLLGWEGEALVAALRVLPPDADHPEVAIGRVVTAPSVRGRGLGRALMVRGVAAVRSRHGDVPIVVHAQAHLEGFYASLGFEVVGPGYLEDGIPHLPLRRGAGRA